MSRFIALAFCLSPLYTFGQYGPPVYLEGKSSSVKQIVTFDANQDLMPDIAILHHRFPEDFVVLHLQDKEGDFNVYAPEGLDSLQDCAFISSGDLDGDNADDIVATYGHPYKLVWFKNTNVEFTEQQLINDSLDFPTQIVLRDFDNDGRTDILLIEHIEIVIYWQGENQIFADRQVLHDGTEFYSIVESDLNHDGFLDIVVGSGGFEVLINNQDRSFTLLPDSWGTSLVFALASEDFDMDGDADIIAWETLLGIYSFKNNGIGTDYIRDTVLQQSENFNSILLQDVNQDDTPDLITTMGQQGQVIWMQNAGDGNFDPPLLIHEETGQLLYQLQNADFNVDGLTDIVWGDQISAVQYQVTVSDVDESKTHSAINVYPNPSLGVVMMDNVSDKRIMFRLSDSMGRVLAKGTVHPSSVHELGRFQTGVYFLVMLSDIGKRIEKIVVTSR